MKKLGGLFAVQANKKKSELLSYQKSFFGRQYPFQASDQGPEDKMTTKGPSPKRQLWNQEQVANFFALAV